MDNDFKVIAVSELAGVGIADRNYVEGKKKYFTWDEACAIEKKLGNGWRLPTRREWVLICEEFGQKDGEDREPDSRTLMTNLGLEMLGWRSPDGHNICDAGVDGNYWSSTPYSSTTGAYFLVFNASDVYPSYGHFRWFGFSVRLVRDIKEN